MKRNLLLAILLVFAFAGLYAQGTDGLGMILRVSIDGVPSDYVEGECGFGTADWGGTLTDEICADAAWGYGITTDTIGCDSIPAGSLNGKIAMIRRLTCEFGEKALHAERAGAIAVMIANGTGATHGDDCFTIPIAVGTTGFGAQVTVPVILICRRIVDQIDNAFKAGKTVEVCFLLPRVSAPFAGYHYATPISQVAELTNMGFNVNNRDNVDLSDLVIKAEITEPGGNVTTITSAVPNLVPGTDTLVFISGYTPPATVGEFNVLFTNNHYTEPRDSLRRTFVQTEYTFATDNLQLQLDGGADRNDLFITNNSLIYQVGSLTAVGPNGGVGKYCTFGIAGVDSVYIPGNSTANTLTIFLYKADSDGNGRLDFDTDFSDMEIKGTGTYEMKGTEKEEVLLYVPISDFETGDVGVALEANELYFISVQYDGNENGSGRNCALTNTAHVEYLAYANEAGDFVATTPIVLGGTRNTWGDRTVVCRLELDGFVPPVVAVGPNLLDASKFAISPNPATDNLMVDLNLEKTNGMVKLMMTNPMGQKLSYEVLKNFKEGQVNMDVKNVPSGVYMLTIITDEGVAVKKVMVCH